MKLHETKQIHAGHGALQDHNIVVCAVVPVQQVNDLWDAVKPISMGRRLGWPG